MTLTQRAAESVAQATPLGLHTLELYREFVADGGGQGDFSGIIKYLARRECNSRFSPAARSQTEARPDEHHIDVECQPAMRRSIQETRQSMNKTSTERVGSTLALILAMDRNALIGKDGGMPWHVPGEQRHFKQRTMGKPMIMGRRTFESIGRALPGRTSIVVTRDPGWQREGAVVASDLDQAIEQGREIAQRDAVNEIMVIGGAALACDALARIDRFYLTHIDHEFEGDTWLEGFQWSDWHTTARRDVTPAEAGGYRVSYLTLE